MQNVKSTEYGLFLLSYVEAEGDFKNNSLHAILLVFIIRSWAKGVCECMAPQAVMQKNRYMVKVRITRIPVVNVGFPPKVVRIFSLTSLTSFCTNLRRVSTGP